MATIKISNLNPADNTVLRAIDARQLQGIKGGFEVAPMPFCYGFKIVNGGAVCVKMPCPST